MGWTAGSPLPLSTRHGQDTLTRCFDEGTLTIIEKIETYHDVGFAVVLLTPDDAGCVMGGKPEPRARQNVLLELSYFMARLTRKNVCVLKRGEVEIPSDFAGVLWVTMDSGIGRKQALGKELEAARYEVDWNRVMRS